MSLDKEDYLYELLEKISESLYKISNSLDDLTHNGFEIFNKKEYSKKIEME
jgi:hypothetical protein